MNDIKKYPILDWIGKEYLSKVLGFLVFLIILGIVYYIFSPKKFHAWLIFAQIQALILYAVVIRQRLLLQYTNNIITATKDNVLKKISISIKDVEQIPFPTWDYYAKKFKKIKAYSSNFLIVCTILIYLYTRDPNLTFLIACVPTIIAIYFLYYIKSIFMQNYLKETISIHESILSRAGKIISTVNWQKYSKRNVMDWIISVLIGFIGIFLYSFKYIDLFTAIIIFLWCAFLYPAIRLTVDLNIQFNRFSSALEKATADLFMEKDEEVK